MKLLIDTDLVLRIKHLDAEDFNIEDYEEVYNLALKAYGVQFENLRIDDNSFQLTIFTQKIVLDEIAMNHLFYDVLEEIQNTKLSYSSLGGQGCDFAMRLTQK